MFSAAYAVKLWPGASVSFNIYSICTSKLKKSFGQEVKTEAVIYTPPHILLVTNSIFFHKIVLLNK